jgi:hypothetical protein
MSDLLMPLKVIKRKMRLLRDCYYDYRRFMKFSSCVYSGDVDKQKALAMMRIHGIEKGLSLEQPRLGFGQKTLSDLFALLEELRGHTEAHDVLELGCSVLRHISLTIISVITM